MTILKRNLKPPTVSFYKRQSFAAQVQISRRREVNGVCHRKELMLSVTITTRKVKKGSQTPVTSPQVPDSISDTIILARTTQGITKKPKTKEEQGLTPKNRVL
jgi:hypothetical protein